MLVLVSAWSFIVFSYCSSAGNADALKSANWIIDAIIANLEKDGALVEACDAANNCNADQQTFKGITVYFMCVYLWSFFVFPVLQGILFLLVHGSSRSQILTTTILSSVHKLIRFLEMQLSVGVLMDLCGPQRDPAPLRAVREAPLVLSLVLPGRTVR